MNKQRKAKLHGRALQYARARTEYTPPSVHGTQLAFEDGYRAAMRDARKVVRDAKDVVGDYANPFDRVKHKNHCVRVQIEQFLRPLR